MSSSRAIFFAAALAILLVAVAAWLLNVPVVAVAIGVVISVLALFLSLARNAVAGKRSGANPDEQKSRPQ